ncbi:MAG: hypothetical protein JSU63_13730 [Phycisphaerales bacterium]|nr:MAG: hypothetical protein JSU63_13730 [Phycisphaerales bacterium]
MLRNVGILLLELAIVQIFVAGCNYEPWGQESPATAALPRLEAVKAISNHYVEVTFAGNAGDAAEVASSYTITDPEGEPLAVHAAELSADARQVTLTTDAQQQVLYTLTVPTERASEAPVYLVPAIDLGSLGFFGSSDREPFLQGAISLNNASLLLTFNERMDRESAQNVAFYRIADPDGITDFDIKIEGAVLDEDETSVVLTTTPQENIAYTVTVTNLKARFTCSDGELTVLDNSDLGQGDVCTEEFKRPLTTEDLIAPFSMSAQTLIGRQDPYNPEDPGAIGDVGTVFTSAYGAEVRGLNCSGDEGISGTGYDSDEELIFTFDREFRADRVILMLREIEFATDEPVLFVSRRGETPQDPSYYVTFTEPDIHAAFAGDGVSRGNVLFEALEPDRLPYGARIDALKLRETNKSIWVESLCLTDGRRIDPTRRTVQFSGIPLEDTVRPSLVDAASTSDITVLLSFSEPLDQDAADPVNFQITCTGCETPDELLVLHAALTRHNTQVILTTHPQTADVEYTVTVSNTNGQVTDLSVNRNPIADGSEDPPGQYTATFKFGGQPSIEPGFALPRVVGAASTSNTTVVVGFNKPMSDSALAASSYSIVQVNVNPEVGTLYVLERRICDEDSAEPGAECASDADCDGGTCLLQTPSFLGPDRTAVELTTTSQSEVTYEVTVTNVHDLAGNQLAPKEIMVDPSRAQFAGTPASGSELVDSDGDGVTDDQELRGWVVMIQQVGGEVLIVEVTSDPSLADTDGDGLDDFAERTRFSNPRSNDTDFDAISDFDEVFVWHTSLTNQDSDGDGIRDWRELSYFKISPLFPDTDGDGLEDGEEVTLQNRDPRIADLPDPGVEVGEVALRLDTRFAYTDTVGESRSVSKSTSSTLSQSDTRTYSTSDASTTQHAVNVSTEIGASHKFGVTGSGVEASLKVNVGYGYTRSNTFTASQSSTEQTQRQFQESLTTDVTRDITQAVTRTVEGASVEVLVTVNNGGDIPFTVRNIQLTGLLQDPYNRRSFLPVATLLPASALEGGGEFEVTLGPFIPLRGPFVFKSSEVFPSLVEDLMKNPRGLIFEVANFDIEDEEGRNFAFVSQEVNDRTAGLIVDYGNGEVERFRVSTHSPFDFNKCAGATEDDLPVDVFCMSDEDCPAEESCLLADPRPIGTTMEFALQDILGLANTKGAPPDAIVVGPGGCADTFADPLSDDIQVVEPICMPVICGGLIVEPGANGVLDTLPAGDDYKDPSDPRTIIDGGNCCAETRASRDDVQVVPADCRTAFPDGIVVLAGPQGEVQTQPAGDDELANVSGYETQEVGACDSNTPRLIDCNVDFDEDGDACESVIPEDSEGNPVDLLDEANGRILPGDNGKIETLPEGDDVLKGPGFPCEADADCPNDPDEILPDSLCRMTEKLVRFKAVKERPRERRFWIILSPVEIPPEVDFDAIRLRSGEVYSLAFVQDKDADGLIAREEFLYGSSDLDENTDGCPFGDGDKKCDPTLYEFDSVRDFEEVRRGWPVAVEGQLSYFAFPNPVLPDTDADHLFDDEEQNAGTDPARQDTDGDGIKDFEELRGYEIKRRDGMVLREVVPYQSAKITPGGGKTTLDTICLSDIGFCDGDEEVVCTEDADCLEHGGNVVCVFLDELGTDADNRPICTPGSNLRLDSDLSGDDVLEGTRLILDGGNGVVETVAARVDENHYDVQVSAPPTAEGNVVAVTFLRFTTPSQTCDGMQIGEYDFEFSVQKNGGAGDFFTESDVPIGPFGTHTFGLTQGEDSNNPIQVDLDDNGSLTISGTVSEKDYTCNVDTRWAIIEPGEVITEPLTGGNGRADTAVPTTAEGVPIYDDIREVPAGEPVVPGQVIISPGPNGVIDTLPAENIIVEPMDGSGDGIANSEVTAGTDDVQVVPTGTPGLQPGQLIIAPGQNAVIDSPPAVDDELIDADDFVPTGNTYADTAAIGDDEQVAQLAAEVAPGDVIVRDCSLGGARDTDPAIPGVCAGPPARAPRACQAAITSGANGVVESSKDPFSDDEQLKFPGEQTTPGQGIISPGDNGVIDSLPALQVIVEQRDGEGDRTANSEVTAGTDDVQVVLVGTTGLDPGQLIIAPGPNGNIDSSAAEDDELVAADDQHSAAHLQPQEDCLLCPLGDCVYDCSLCTAGQCIGDDVLLVRKPATSCEGEDDISNMCPCGQCIPALVTWDFTKNADRDFIKWLRDEAPDQRYTWDLTPSLFDVVFGRAHECFRNSRLHVMLEWKPGVTVDPVGGVLVRPGPDGVLQTVPQGDDVIGTSHLAFFATDPLNRDTDHDGLFDGTELELGANPNDELDASKYRDNDLDGLPNHLEKTDGWFIGYVDRSGRLFCRVRDERNADGTFKFTELLKEEEFDPPESCEFVWSDPFEPDTDFDGLPDLLEYLIRSDPRTDDTDEDGLSDLEEFDPGSTFSVDLGTFREFERRCGDAERCAFVPLEETCPTPTSEQREEICAPYGTSVVRADSDEDGRSDHDEVFDCWVISPCIGTTKQNPQEVCSHPLSRDWDLDGVLDGLERSQGTDPQNPNTDGDGYSDNPKYDPDPSGCGRFVTVTFEEYRVGANDCDPAAGGGDFRFNLMLTTPAGVVTFWDRHDDCPASQPVRLAENHYTFLLRETGEGEFSIHGMIYDLGNGTEVWWFTRGPFYYEHLEPPSDLVPEYLIYPQEEEEGMDEYNNGQCFLDGGHYLKVAITYTGA